jgi:hypothetical protein
MKFKVVWEEAHIVTVEADNEAEAKLKFKNKEIIDEYKERIGVLDIYTEEDL